MTILFRDLLTFNIYTGQKSRLWTKKITVSVTGQKNEKLTGQLVSQETDQNHMDAPLIKLEKKVSLIAHSNFKELAKDTPIIVHGHSLGSGISVEVLANLCQDQNKCPPTALILGKSPVLYTVGQ